MASNRKFKREYIILEAKDMNFKHKERILPKAFAKIEVTDEKSVVALYVENLKCMKDGYRVVAIRSDYETIDLGKVNLSEQGKGEFSFDLDSENSDIKGIALLYEKTVPLIGFKGSKIDNYEEILFIADEPEYEEVEYIEVEDEYDRDYEYEEVEYIEVDDDDEEYEYEEVEEYEEIEDIQPEYIRNYQSMNMTSKNTSYIDESNSLEYNRTNKIPHKQINQKSQPRDIYSDLEPEKISYQSTSSNSKVPGTLLMPRQIKKGLKYFKEVKPFIEDYIENTRWWKIDITPATLCNYTMPYLGYLNGLNYTMYSDATMQAYKYRHYLFGVQYDEYNKRKNYIYAVPGKQQEQPDQGHTGFRMYQPCDTRSNNSLGYWLCYIDSRSRVIVK